MEDLDRRKLVLKEEFKRTRGHWSSIWNDLLSADADFFEAYLKFSSVPWKTGTLEPKVKELIYIAIDASTTHLYEPGLRSHIRNALGHGATREEILEVFQLTTTLGIHAMAVGVPALVDEAKQAGKTEELPSGPLDAVRTRLKDNFVASRGYWNALWEQILQLDPALFEAYAELSSIPWKKGSLGPKVKEFIYIAIDAAATHLFEPGIRVHLKNAFAHGATVAEIMEVLELVSVLGIHTCTMGVPILLEELERFERPGSEA
jgi:alkylhydroperoxidase/carboxymuconolactone decarboxylase family protein YurZ